MSSLSPDSPRHPSSSMFDPTLYLTSDSKRNTDWTDFASCRDIDPEIFFNVKLSSTEQSRTICSTCIVKHECLDFAIKNNEKIGIWGGLTPRQRKRLLNEVSPWRKFAEYLGLIEIWNDRIDEKNLRPNDNDKFLFPASISIVIDELPPVSKSEQDFFDKSERFWL